MASYNKTQWYKDLKASNPNCIYCDTKLNNDTFTVDHIELASNGGADSFDNCKPSCKFCNQLRGNMEYDDFITLYSKERILKLKEYTENNKDINGIDIMNESIDSISIIHEQLNNLLSKKEELQKLKEAYKILSDKVRNEIAYSRNLNASEGYKLYVKQREIDRQYLKYKNEHTFISKYIVDLSDINNKINNIKTSMTVSIKDSTISKPLRTLEEDLETVMNNTVNSIVNNNIETLKAKNVQTVSNKSKQYKEYRYTDANNRKQLYCNLMLIWDNIKEDVNSKSFKCSIRKTV